MRRYRTDTYSPMCMTCSEEFVQGFGYKVPRRCQHVRNRNAIRKFEQRIGARVRTQSQRVFRPSSATKALWREIRAAKTRPAIERRAQAWLDSLLSDTRDGDFEAGRHTKRVYVGHEGKVVVSSHVSTYHSTPTVERVPLTGGLLGDFRRSFIHNRYGVRLASHLAPEELRRTLVHEALHVVDSEADVDDHNHGMLWRKRLAEMERHFSPLARGRL
jgi:hypothetical protein